MTDKEKEALNDRFSGYQLPTIDLEAGFTVYQVPVHPYFFNQSLEWSKPAYTTYNVTGPQLIGGDFPITQSGYSDTGNQPNESDSSIAGSSGSSEVIIRGESKDNNEGARVDLLPF